MKKINISIFLNYKKSRNPFLYVRRWIQYYRLKCKLRKNANIITFKNQYHILTSSNKKLCDYFCFSTNDITIILGDKDTLKQNRQLWFELNDITQEVYLFMYSNFAFFAENAGVMINNLEISTVGIDLINVVQNNDIEENKKSFIKEVYPKLVDECLGEIETLFEPNVGQKRKRFLTLTLLGKDFSLIERILNTYGIDKYIYFKQKQELMECGYDVERLERIYFSFYEKINNEFIE